MIITRREHHVRRLTRRLFVGIGAEIRQLRDDAGVSQAALAREAEISPSMLSKIERGEAAPSLAILTTLALALGTDLGVRFYANTGPAIRDRTQARMVEALLRAAHDRWTPYLEVPIHRPARGVIDVVLADPGEGLLVATESESSLRRLEQQIRWANEKAEGLRHTDLARFGLGGREPQVSQLLLLRSTRATRELARSAERILAAAYPGRTRDAFAALCDGKAWPGPSIIWVSVDGATAHLLDRPPPGVRLGR